MKPTWLLGIGLLGLAVLVLTVHTVSGTGPGALFAQNAKLDRRVLEDTAGGRVGRFLVVLKEQADPQKAAGQARNRRARRHLAVDALRRAAAHSQPAVRTQLDALAVDYRAYWIANVIAVEGDRAVVDALARRGDVLAIESDRAFRVPLEQPEGSSSRVPSGIEWNIEWVNAPDVWALGYTGQGIIYANADTGVDWDHPALKSQYRGWNGTTADHNYSWWDAIHSDISGDGTNPCGFSSPVPCADYGHGTHTMGIGVGDDGAGSQVGMAPGAKWIACRNMDQGVGRPSTYIECMQFFLAPTDLDGNNPDPSKGPDVVGNSFGCPPSEGCSTDSLQLATQNLRDAGVFMAVSAGNSGPECSTIDDPPALEDSAITVGASDFQTDSIAGLSSRGPVAVDGSNRRKPDLVAPGVRVRSSYPADTYSSLTGTSMAAPHVAGAAALLWSAYPDLRGNVDLTEFVLGETALHLTTTEGCGGDSPTQVPNNVYGHGRIDALAAYEYLVENPPPTPTPTATATLSNTPTATNTPVTPTETATPGVTPTATPTGGVCVPPFTSIVASDTDCDGAPDAAELGPNQFTCGTRNPNNPWDFYDVPAPTIANGGNMTATRNSAINITGDVLAVLEYSGTSPTGTNCNSGPDGIPGNADDRCYNDDKDGDGVDDGIVYDRSAAATWSGPPDGAISILTDVLLVLAQTGHTC